MQRRLAEVQHDEGLSIGQRELTRSYGFSYSAYILARRMLRGVQMHSPLST